MRKLALAAVILMVVFVLAAAAQGSSDQRKVVQVATGTANTLDPHYAYDTASGAIIFNIYESLVRWPYGIADGDEYDPSYSLDPNDLKPMLATDWSISSDGKIYEFTIRNGVSFHNGGELTPEDVEYSLERGLLQDRNGGPMWMLLRPLTGFSSLRSLASDVLGYEVGDEELRNLSPSEQAQIYNGYIDPSVEVSGNKVILNLEQVYPPLLSILAHGNAVGSVIDKEWSIGVGCWDGSPDNWASWYDPAQKSSSLYNVTNGTGPFKLESWNPGQEAKLSRFDGYWQENAYLENVVIKKNYDWVTRKEMFNNGEADFIYVPVSKSPDVLEDVKVHGQLPTVQMNPAGFFVSPVEMKDNEFMPSGPWNGNGIPADLFSDLKVRKAFCLAFDYQAFINKVLNGHGYMTHGPIPKNLSWAYNPDPNLIWTQDLEEAESLLKEARDGEIWEKGFNIPIAYNEGNYSREMVGKILEKNLESLNDKFDVTLIGLGWNDYLNYMLGEKWPFFVIGWLADFPDPHNFAVPFTSSKGTFSGWQGSYMEEEIFKPVFDPLIEKGMASTSRAERADAYYQISKKAHELAADMWLPQAYGLRVLKRWLQDVPFNPIFPGYYFYPVKKTSPTTHTKNLSAGWHLFSLPGIPEYSNPEKVLGDDLGEGFNLYSWENGSYSTYPIDEISLKSGEAYWVKVQQEEGVELDMSLYPLTEKFTVNFDDSGWHQLGSPVGKDIKWSDASVSHDGKVLDLQEAVDRGWLKGYLFNWSNSLGKYKFASAGDAILCPWSGYWIKTDVDSLKITLPLESSTQSSQEVFTGLTETGDTGGIIPPPPPQDVEGQIFALAAPNPITAGGKVSFELLLEDVHGVKQVELSVVTPGGKHIYDASETKGKSISWNLVNNEGDEVSNGIYLYRLRATMKDGEVRSSNFKKLLILR